MSEASPESLHIAMLGSRGVLSRYSGIEVALRELCPRLAARGHQVTVYARWDGGPRATLWRGVTVLKVPAVPTKHLETLTRTALSVGHALIRGYDVVHLHAVGPALFAPLPRARGSHVIVTVQGLDWQRRKWGWLARRVLRAGEYAAARFPHATIVVSPVLKRYFDTKYHLDTVYIPNGVSLPVCREPEIIRQYGLAGQDYVLFASRLVPEKGCHHLIEAFLRLRPNLRLVIAGGAEHSDAYARRLREQAASAPAVIFVGHVEGPVLEELFSNAYLYILPSEVEGLSLSLLEAMAYGRCALVSDIPENACVVEGNLGFTFRSGDVDDLAQMLAFLVAQPQLVAETGRRARAHVAQHYNWDTITDQTEALYRALVAR
jgi:glycosyltransferase involved in cell wall biosynthesis